MWPFDCADNELRERYNELCDYLDRLETRIRVLEGTAPSDSRVTHTVPVGVHEGNVFYPANWGR